MDWEKLIDNPLAQLCFALFTAAGAWRFYRTTSTADAKDRADSGGQIAALETWKELLEGERAARIRAEERADKFAAERTEAMREVYLMRGQLEVMTKTIAAQTDELESLREQVRALKEQINGL